MTATTYSPRLSVCLIVRNEAAGLARCLESVRGLADEIVVVDTGSTDDTVAIARGAGAVVSSFAWGDDFSAARNAALERAHGAWILVIDGDEWLAPESGPALRAIVAREPAEAFHVVQCSLDPAGAVVRAAAVRLFPRRPDVRYRYPIHEEVNASLRAAGIPIGAAPILLLHTGYAKPVVVAAKTERNRRIATAALARGATAEEALHLRFCRGCLNFDARDWRAAVEDFAWCADYVAAQPDGRVAAARIRAAECWAELGEDARAQALLPETPTPAVHPQALALGARLARRRGAMADTRDWYRALLAVAEQPFTPPVALAPLREEAEAFLTTTEA